MSKRDQPIVRVFDIEVAPNLADVWQFYNTNVGANQIVRNGHIMSFAYKDLGEDWVYYVENRELCDKDITADLVEMLDEADIVIAHNGLKFDLGWVRGRAAIHGISPPSPFKVIDTLKECKKAFYFPMYKLEYLAKAFNLTEKLQHKNFPGHSLWTECLRGNDAAWKEMEAYNIQDVETLEELYLKIRPYISRHPNLGIYQEEDVATCPKCGSSDIHYRGYYSTNLAKYRKFKCKSCGGWGRERLNLLSKGKRKSLTTNAI